MTESNETPTIGRRRIHGVAIPFPAQGHINPMMQLCRKLASSGIAITFVHSDHNYNRLARSAVEEDNDMQKCNVLDIRMVSIPDGLPPEHVRTGDFLELASATQGPMMVAFDQLVRKLLDKTPPVSFILFDALMHGAQILARSLGLPGFAFRTTCAAAAALSHHVLPLLLDKGILLQGANVDDIARSMKPLVRVPGLPPLQFSAVPSFFVDKDIGPFCVEFYDRVRKASMMASRLLVNSFYALESRCVDSMATAVEMNLVGPLFPLNDDDMKPINHRGTSLWAEQGDVLQWLDAQPSFSVVYIAFGSVATLSPAQVQELALGLEASQQSFVWVYRPDLAAGADIEMLEEFSSRMRERGRIISWAPQVRVLSHPSVGAFISHCGWNSCLESICTGVPILAWPSAADQQLNATLAVEEWKIGLHLTRGSDGMIGRDEIGRLVRATIEGKVGRELRIMSSNLKEAARKAIGPRGSSHKVLEAIIEDVEKGKNSM